MADYYELMEEMGVSGNKKKKDAAASEKTEYTSTEQNDFPDDLTETEEDSEDGDGDGEEYDAPKKKKKRRRKHPLLGLLIFAGLVFGAVKFMGSEFFTVTDIKVDGNHFYTKAQIIEMAGLRTGCNLFFDVDIVPAKDALLEDPYIRIVSVRRELPGTLRVAIEERTEYAAVPYGENYILIDQEGMVLRISDREPVLPLLTGLTLVEMMPGSSLQVEQPYMLTDTLALIGMMDENDIYFKQIRFSAVVVKAYIYDDLYCEGTPENISSSMAEIYDLLLYLYKNDIVHGVIKVGSDGYIAYSPDFE